MAGKTMVDGTAYNIDLGKTRIEGTNYSITGGKTLIGGTAYNIRVIPTFEDLFKTYSSSYNSRRNSSSKATLSQNIGNWAQYAEGKVAYCFFATGSSLEISRLDFGASAITKTQLSLTAYSDSTKVATTVSGKTISSASTIYSGVIVTMLFNSTYSPTIIDYMFQNGWKSNLKYYLSSTASATTTTSTNTRIETSTVTNGTGVVMAFFASSSYTDWSVSLSTTPLVPIKSYVAGTSSTKVALVEITVSNVDYLYPSEDESTITAVRSYTLKRLYEDW